ncbi:unnamed protein product [Choristocarpus tenellus]
MEVARLLDALSSDASLTNEDPRWALLLDCGDRVLEWTLSSPKMAIFAERMVKNNPRTGNFPILVALASTTIRKVLSATPISSMDKSTRTARRDGYTGGVGMDQAGVKTCRKNTGGDQGIHGGHCPEVQIDVGVQAALAALHVTRVFASYMISVLNATQLRTQFFAHRGSKATVATDSGGGTIKLLQQCVTHNAVGHEGAEKEHDKGGNKGDIVQPVVPAMESGEGRGGRDTILVLLSTLVSLCGVEKVQASHYDLHLCGVNLLITLLGTQMYSPLQLNGSAGKPC